MGTGHVHRHPRALVTRDGRLPVTAHVARSRQQEARHFQNGEFRHPGVHMIGDVAKELPEDAELENLVDMDIPGLVTPGERSFDFVEAKVRDQLSYLFLQKQDVIVGILGGYEPTIFETREMPRLAPNPVSQKWKEHVHRLVCHTRWRRNTCQS